jgi:hypothetical protein
LGLAEEADFLGLAEEADFLGFVRPQAEAAGPRGRLLRLKAFCCAALKTHLIW